MSGVFGETLDVPQAVGPKVALRVAGDEFYARYETLDGYTCIYDAKVGQFCYAGLRNGRFSSSGVAVTERPPAALPLHLRESPAVHNSKFDDCFASLQLPPKPASGDRIPEAFGSVSGLLPGRQLNRERVVGLTVLVDFADVHTMTTADDVASLLNDEGGTVNGNFCSVREYFRRMSGNALDYQNIVVGPVQLNHERSYYVAQLLAYEALDLALGTGISLSDFDSRGEKLVDALSFMYAGDTMLLGKLWPHNGRLTWHHEDYTAYTYQVTSLGANSGDLTIGTFCHESGHMLCRFPDLYDYGERDEDFKRSAGLGYYCLMSAGNCLGNGFFPSPIAAYFRKLANWSTNVCQLKPGAYRAIHGDYRTVMIYTRSGSPNEFFLIENRCAMEMDKGLPSSGLAVYHCDTQGSNEWQGGSAVHHYQCGLLQADGSFHLENNMNQGDPGDFFAARPGIVLSDSTVPSTRWWDGTESGLCIADIGAAGETMTFRVL